MMLNDYYIAVRELLDRLCTKISELNQQHKLQTIPHVLEFRADLELALYHDATDNGNRGVIEEKTIQIKELSKFIDTQINSIELINKILTPYKIKLLYSNSESKPPSYEINSDEVIHQEHRKSPTNENDETSEIKSTQEQSIACINNGIDTGDTAVSLAEGKEIVVFLSDTGAGKSTAINYLNGCAMVKKARGIIDISPNSLQKEITAIGHDSRSKTFIPQVIVSENTGLIFGDFPGFVDNRGSEINIINAINIKRVLNAADFLKFVVLISYESLFTDRAQSIAKLMKTLDMLLGCNLDAIRKHILIGITKVPVSIDGEAVTIQSLREKLFNSSQLPIELKSQTHIIDPLDRQQPNYCLSRAEWISNIKNLVPIKKSTQVFNTTLNDTDRLFLITISKDISHKIECHLKMGKFTAVKYYLSLLVKLRVIDYQEIEQIIQDNLLKLSKYLSDREQEVFDLSDQANFKSADEKLSEMKKLINLSQANFPEFKFQIANSGGYLHHEKMTRNLDEVSKQLYELKKQYYQSTDDIALLSNAIVQSVQIVQLPETPLAFVMAVLTHFQNIPKINEPAQKLLFGINDFINNYPEYENIERFSESIKLCTCEFESILANAKKISQNFIHDKMLTLDLYIYESICTLLEKVMTQIPNEKFLLKLSKVDESSGYAQLQEVLNELLQEELILTRVQFLSISLSYLHKLCKADDDERRFISQVQFVQIRLLELKDKLEDIQRKRKQEDLAEQERQLNLKQKLEQEIQRSQALDSKLNEIEKLIEIQKNAMNEKSESERQAQLKSQELQLKHEQLAKKNAEDNKVILQHLQTKIIAETNRNLKAAKMRDIKRRVLEQHTTIKKKHIQIMEKRQKFIELQQLLGVAKNDNNNDTETADLEYFQKEFQPSSLEMGSELSDLEIEEIVKKEVELEQARENNREDLTSKEFVEDEKLEEITTSRSNNLLNLEILKARVTLCQEDYDEANEQRNSMENRLTETQNELLTTKNLYFTSKIIRLQKEQEIQATQSELNQINIQYNQAHNSLKCAERLNGDVKNQDKLLGDIVRDTFRQMQETKNNSERSKLQENIEQMHHSLQENRDCILEYFTLCQQAVDNLKQTVVEIEELGRRENFELENALEEESRLKIKIKDTQVKLFNLKDDLNKKESRLKYLQSKLSKAKHEIELANNGSESTELQLFNPENIESLTENALVDCVTAITQGHHEILEKKVEQLDDNSLLELAQLCHSHFLEKKLALMYFKRLSDKNNQTAIFHLNQMIEKDPECANELAKLYELDATDDAKEQAYKCYAKAALKGHKESHQYLEEQATSGNKVAQYMLGHEYYLSVGIFDRAVHWCLLSAVQNYQLAKNYLVNDARLNAEQCLMVSRKFEEEGSLKADIKTALCFYEKAFCLGNKEAALYLGYFYQVDHEEIRILQDNDKACDYLIKAALLGSPDALTSLECLGNDVSPVMQFKIAQMYNQDPVKDNYKHTIWKKTAAQSTQAVINFSTKSFSDHITVNKKAEPNSDSPILFRW